jgi:DNA-binding LytR/AlgR family response regulator
LNVARQICVLVADAEPRSLELAANTIQVDPRLTIAARCSDGAGVIEALDAAPVDVAVLDIRLPRIDGLALARTVARRDDPPEIVFVTALAEHALEAYDLGVCDYVVKPYEPERLRRAVLRAASRRCVGVATPPIRSMERLMVRCRTATQLLEFHEIEAVDADEKEVWLHAGGKRLRYSSTISAMEGVLPCPPFVRVHRSHMVNLDHVRRVDDSINGTGSIALTSGAAVPISRRYRRRLTALFLGTR